MKSMIMSGSSVDFLQRLFENSRVVKMEYDADVFEVKLDVEKYEPNELSVKVHNDHLIVSGKHEKKRTDEFGLVAQQFTRQFLMPEDINLDTLSSSLSSEGILTVRALVKGDGAIKQNINIDEENNIQREAPKNDDGHSSNADADPRGAVGGGDSTTKVYNSDNSNNNNNTNNTSNNESSKSNNNNNDSKVS